MILTSTIICNYRRGPNHSLGDQATTLPPPDIYLHTYIHVLTLTHMHVQTLTNITMAIKKIL